MVSTYSRSSRFALLALIIGGCGSDNDPLDSSGAGASNPATSVSAGSTNNTSAGSTSNPTDGGATDGGTDGMTDGTTGGPAPTRETCDRYLDCLAATDPASLPDAQMGYGPDGTCWEGTPDTMAQCIEACQTGLEQLNQAHPNEPACYVCSVDADCGLHVKCMTGSCVPDCGNGVVEDHEVCDNDYCLPDCSGEGCNPLTGAGCPEGQQCLVKGEPLLMCGESVGLPGLHEPCSTEPPELPSCAPGLICIHESFSGSCGDVTGDCCTGLCNLQAPDTCPDGTSCQEWPIGGPQIDYVGVCII